MAAFIDEHRDTYGVEPICEVLPIAPSTYHAHQARQRDPELRPARANDLVEHAAEPPVDVHGETTPLSGGRRCVAFGRATELQQELFEDHHALQVFGRERQREDEHPELVVLVLDQVRRDDPAQLG